MHCKQLLYVTRLVIPRSANWSTVSPVVSVGTDWCFLALDYEMICAIPFVLTLNYGAVCLFVFLPFVSILYPL
jgi:hypothetical protein